MKAFIISTILFALLIATVFGNAFYVKSVSERIVSDLEILKEENYPLQIANGIESYWLKHRSFVALSVGHEELDHVSQTIISLKASCESKNSSDANMYASILQDAANEIGRHEEISLENLF